MKRRRVARWSWVDAPAAVRRAALTASGPGMFSRPVSRREHLIGVAIGAEVARLRAQRDLAQWELADRLAVSQPQVSYLERGRATVALSLLWDLADVFDVAADHFVAVAAAAIVGDRAAVKRARALRR